MNRGLSSCPSTIYACIKLVLSNMPINTEHRSKDDTQRLERLHNTEGKVEDVVKRGVIYILLTQKQEQTLKVNMIL